METAIKKTLTQLIKNIPNDWVTLTTHRLDIYNEAKAKTEFLSGFENLESYHKENLESLPTAYDYIRLGHPLSCILEWAIAKKMNLKSESVIAFSSQTMPILSVLRKNKFLKKKTQILYTNDLPLNFNPEVLKEVYDYDFELLKIDSMNEARSFNGSTLVINGSHHSKADFNLELLPHGSVIAVLDNNEEYINEIQHVRRRESIAITPTDSLNAINELLGEHHEVTKEVNEDKLIKIIQEITSSNSQVAIGSSGLSVQYAIMMGLVHYAQDHHPGKKIKFIVPPNCYGGTNNQARRVAQCLSHVEIIDLPVDSGKDMVTELEKILNEVAKVDAVPYIIAEIPTNPRVEVPDIEALRVTLKKKRNNAIEPVFILDQTFCPNVTFFGKDGYLPDVKVISYVSGSKFPSGGLCTAGYAASNELAQSYMSYVINHLSLTSNTATHHQIKTLIDQMPSMNNRISKAHINTRAFVNHIEKKFPSAKINFVSHELADGTFTPSVFSLDLHDQKRNHILINMMISEIPDQAKHCVSYGQLKGSYWTIPATSTQGTTKESDKDYIVRVSIAPDFNLEKHIEVFDKFVDSLNISS